MRPRRGCGQLIYYNCGGPEPDMCDCMNPTRIRCPCCYQFDHEVVDFLTLITQMREKGVLQPASTQNIQMMRTEPCEGDPNVNIVLRSGMNIGEDKEKQPGDDVWVCKTPTKASELDSGCTKEMDMEAMKSFVLADSYVYRKFSDKPSYYLIQPMI